MASNLTTIYNSGSLYEQLISQVIAVESQPRLTLRAEQTEQSVYKGVLSDFSSRVSTLNTLLDKLRDPLQTPFTGKAATVGTGAGFSASAGDGAATGTHEIRVDRMARADARLSTQLASAGTALSDAFGGSASTFTVHIAQPEGDPVALEVSYAPATGATDHEVLDGLVAAVNAAAEAARAAGRLAEGTGVSASVVHETSGTSRLSLRGLATGYANRLTFDDPDGLLAALEVDRTAARTGTGGGAVYAVGSGPEDSALSAAFTLDGLTLYRDTNAVDDALDGVTLTLSSVTEAAEPLTIGSDVKGMRSQVDAFIKSYNGLVSFLSTKSAVDPEAGTRGTFAGDAAIRGLRYGMRSDLARGVTGAGAFGDLAALGITANRDGTLTLSDATTLENALASSPEAVGALFAGDDGLAARLSSRLEGLLGSNGTIEQRKKGVDARIDRIDAQIARWDSRLTRREETLRAQFAQLEQIMAQATAQQSTLTSFYTY